MKKIMFAAIAVVAFNGVSFANTAEEVKIETPNEIIQTEVFKIQNFNGGWLGFAVTLQKYAPCFSAVEGIQLKGKEHGLSQDLIDDIAAKAFHNCANTIDG